MERKRTAPQESSPTENDPPKPPLGGWKVSARWTIEDTFALEALRPLGEAFLPWTGFALSPSAILKVLTLAEFHRPRVILELGAGLSTVFIARYLRYADRSGTRLISIDDNANWLGMISEYLGRESLSGHAELVHARRHPWSTGDEDAENGNASWKYKPPGHWYSPRPMLDALGKDRVDFLLIDGPKGKGTISRYPALAELKDNLAERAVVILDDAEREPEEECLRRWEELTELSFETQKGTGLAVAAPR